MDTAELNKEYTNLVLSDFKTKNPLLKLSKNNRESLKEIIKYLIRLNKGNLINEKQFSDLVSMACANYIENEVELRANKYLDKIVFSVF